MWLAREQCMCTSHCLAEPGSWDWHEEPIIIKHHWISVVGGEGEEGTYIPSRSKGNIYLQINNYSMEKMPKLTTNNLTSSSSSCIKAIQCTDQFSGSFQGLWCHTGTNHLPMDWEYGLQLCRAWAIKAKPPCAGSAGSTPTLLPRQHSQQQLSCHCLI